MFLWTLRWPHGGPAQKLLPCRKQLGSFLLCQLIICKRRVTWWQTQVEWPWMIVSECFWKGWKFQLRDARSCLQLFSEVYFRLVCVTLWDRLFGQNTQSVSGSMTPRVTGMWVKDLFSHCLHLPLCASGSLNLEQISLSSLHLTLWYSHINSGLW